MPRSNRVKKETSKQSSAKYGTAAKKAKPESHDVPDETWVAATSTYNYMMKEPLLDWLRLHHADFVARHSDYTSTVSTCLQDTGYNFTNYIMKQGVNFENKVMKLITKKFGAERIARIHGEEGARDPRKVKATLDAMKAGIPIIHSGVLHNPTNKTFGIPDLLVRSDWLKYLVRTSPLPKELEKRAAPHIGKKYHYRVIDIKFTGLLLRADANHLLNSASFPAYKAQLLIYNLALGQLQGYTPKQVYILGRRWKYSSKGETHIGNACFDKLGIIDYDGKDSKYVDETAKAIEWIREVRSPEAANWDIINYPLHRPELYPNMCNLHDHPWHPVKERIANENDELTNLWMVGPKNRAKALEEGVCQWSDPECDTSILGVNGPKTSRVLSAILAINQGDDVLIAPKYIKNNINNWKEKDTVEFFVDFETCGGAVASIKYLPAARTTNIIFMIGVGYAHPKTKKWIYKDFTTQRLTHSEEERICREFSNYVLDVAETYGVEDPSCYHWANAEDSMWMDAFDRHKETSHEWRADEWHWVDLLQVFKEEPIVIKGCMSFGLKSVASTMKKHHFIKTGWDKNIDCVDGQGAMVAARKAHAEAKAKGCAMTDIPIVKDIIQYNEVDVKVLYEIITYLRRYHVKNSTEPKEEHAKPVVAAPRKISRKIQRKHEAPKIVDAPQLTGGYNLRKRKSSE